MLADSFVKLGDRVPAWVARAFRSDGPAARLTQPLFNRLMPAREHDVSVRSGPGTGLVLPVMLKSEKYYWSGTHERHVQETMTELLQPGMTFWDIGAHIGFFSMIAARLVGEGGDVLCFEPMPDTRRRLRRSIELNGFRNVSVYEFAIDSSEGNRTLRPPEPSQTRGDEAGVGTPMWTLDESRGDGTGVPVQCRRLDDLTDLSATPDLVKIDAEGAEIDALAGGIGLLGAGNTRVIVEMSGPEELERGRRLLPDHEFRLIGGNHWLVTL